MRHSAAIESIAPKIGCTASQTLLGRIRRDEVDSGEREGVSTPERGRLKALEHDVKELLRAIEILEQASVFFAQVLLDCHLES
jgi:transposase-like protein